MTVESAPMLPLVVEGPGKSAVERLRAGREELRVVLRERGALLLTTTALAADGQTLRLLVDELAERYAGTPPTDEVLQYSQFA
ncbi:hypothetical protein AB0H73_39810, partial [Streptomyces olivoreticuli]